MHDKDYCETVLLELAEALDRMAERPDARVDMAATLSHAEATLMHLADPAHHGWLCTRFEALAAQHDIVAHCARDRAQGDATAHAGRPARGA